MRQVYFKKIKIQNFLSVGETPLELSFNSGINLITGENRDKGGRNGVGKSSFIESLYWVLFGSTIRDIKRERIIHNQSKNGCEVKLFFSVTSTNKNDEYILTRSIEPNKVHLSCNGIDITRSSMPKTDELIKELIGANEDVFQNAVIMTANNTTPFMGQKKVDKRKFVEGVLNLSIFSNMLLQVRSDFNDVKKESDITSNLFLDKQKNLEIYQTQFLKEENTKSQKVKSLQEKIENNKNKLNQISLLNEEDLLTKQKSLSETISSSEKKIEKLESLALECSQKYNTFLSSEQEINFNISQLTKQKKSLLQKTKECPTCKRPYEESDKECVSNLIKEIEGKIELQEESLETVKKELKVQQKNCDVITQNIFKLKNQAKSNTEEMLSLSMVHKDVAHLSELNRDIEKQIEELNSAENSFEILIKTVSDEIKLEELKLESLQKRLSVLESAKYVVSEEGVKTFIIKKMLALLNSRLNYYLQALEAPCRCEFNEMFEETIRNDQGVECSYYNFSGGERKRIDLAILFMFQDLLRSQTGTSFSLSMYDELFDSALDEKGVDKILDILKDRVEKYKENIYIISHNKASIKSGINQVIVLEKHNGSTKILA